MEDSVEAASPLRLAQLVVPGQIPFPHLRDEEEVRAGRLRVDSARPIETREASRKHEDVEGSPE